MLAWLCLSYILFVKASCGYVESFAFRLSAKLSPQAAGFAAGLTAVWPPHQTVCKSEAKCKNDFINVVFKDQSFSRHTCVHSESKKKRKQVVFISVGENECRYVAQLVVQDELSK